MPIFNKCFALPIFIVPSPNNNHRGSEAYQINEQTVNDLFVQTIIANNTTLSPAQQGVLEAIAAQSPLSGGEAVLRARALLLGLGVVPVVYDDEKLCFVQERPGLEDRNQATPSAAALWVYPNPAAERLNIAWHGQSSEEKTFCLMDLYGRLITEIKLLGLMGSTQIDLKDLIDGFYVYSLKDVEGRLSSGKILIQH